MEGFPWWTEKQRKLAEEVNIVVDETILPLAEKCSWRKEYPWVGVREVAKRGWFGALIPAEYGGRGEEWGVTGMCIILEELARAGEAFTPMAVTIQGGLSQLLHHGNEEQRQRWLPRIAKGELLASITITEPYAGSDAAAIETIATREGDVYVVNGKKRFQTGAAVADLYMTYVKTSDQPEDRAKYRHLTGLIIEKGTPGFTIEKVNDLMGFEGVYNCCLNFDNVRVPAANRLGEEGDGWMVMMSGLNLERIVGAATFLGLMREPLRYAVQHLERRVQFGQPLINVTTNQFKVADMISRLLMARLITYHTAHLLDLGKDTPLEAATAKLFSSESLLQSAVEAIQCMGGNGVTKYYPVERIMQHAKVTQIYQGTNEIMKVIIFRQGLRSMVNDLKVPFRAIDDELKVPMPLGKAPPLKTASSEEDLLAVLAEEYRVNTGLHMTKEDIKERLDISDEDFNKYLISLEEKGLINLFRDRRGTITLARATFIGLAKANPLEYYKYTPSWVNEEDIF